MATDVLEPAADLVPGVYRQGDRNQQDDMAGERPARPVEQFGGKHERRAGDELQVWESQGARHAGGSGTQDEHADRSGYIADDGGHRDHGRQSTPAAE